MSIKKMSKYDTTIIKISGEQKCNNCEFRMIEEHQAPCSTCITDGGFISKTKWELASHLVPNTTNIHEQRIEQLEFELFKIRNHLDIVLNLLTPSKNKK